MTYDQVLFMIKGREWTFPFQIKSNIVFNIFKFTIHHKRSSKIICSKEFLYTTD